MRGITLHYTEPRYRPFILCPAQLALHDGCRLAGYEEPPAAERGKWLGTGYSLLGARLGEHG